MVGRGEVGGGGGGGGRIRVFLGLKFNLICIVEVFQCLKNFWGDFNVLWGW